MGITFIARPAAPAVRKVLRTRYRETLTPDGWERITPDQRKRQFRGLATVRIGRTETIYREPIGTRGEKSAVSFTVTGPDRNAYLAACLPTARVTTDDGTTTFAVWYY